MINSNIYFFKKNIAALSRVYYAPDEFFTKGKFTLVLSLLEAVPRAVDIGDELALLR